jgi:tetratricopeptide (TPR) repeat protein
MNYFSQFKKISEKPWFYPAVLLLMGLIVYEYALPSFGYFWDDWEIVMFAKLNPSLQFGYYASDRPFPWTYQLTYFLVGLNPIGWHIFTLLYRWGAVLFFVFALTLLWPRYVTHLRWMGALLMFYPGFLEQSQSATKDRHIATFFLFALSLYLMILAVKRPKWAWLLFPLSWLSAFTQLFTTEYFSGLELIRPVILWMLIADHKKIWSSLGRTAFRWLPYLLILVFYFWCRLIFFPSFLHTTSHAGDIKSLLSSAHSSLISTGLALFSAAFSDLIYSVLQVWIGAVTNLPGFTFQSKIAWLAFGLGALLTIVFAFFQDIDERESSDVSTPVSVLVIGFLLFALGALPIWAIGKQVSAVGSWVDRFSLAPMGGASLMVVALLLWLAQPQRQKLILSILLVSSIATQVIVVNSYRADWQSQRGYYWQLYWRAPALQNGTALFSDSQPSPSMTFDNAGFALNVLYHYQTKYGSLPYWLFIAKYLPAIKSDVQISHFIRNLEFKGNTSDGIAVVHQTNISCLLVLDSVYKDASFLENGGKDLISISDVNRIIPDPKAAAPDPNIFGPEPAHDWCYYFEKADLARQTGDWKMAITLYQQAKLKGLAPRYGAEYIPFIEAYAQTGDWQTAYDLTRSAQRLTGGLETTLCANWSRFNQISSPDAKVIEQVRQSLSCTNF